MPGKTSLMHIVYVRSLEPLKNKT